MYRDYIQAIPSRHAEELGLYFHAPRLHSGHSQQACRGVRTIFSDENEIAFNYSRHSEEFGPHFWHEQIKMRLHLDYNQ